jgi:hypothetical protein
VETLLVYVNRLHLADAINASNGDPKALAKLLLPLVFKAKYIKYCTVSGKTGSELSGYKCSDGTHAKFAPLYKEGIDAILSKLKMFYCYMHLILLNKI